MSLIDLLKFRKNVELADEQFSVEDRGSEKVLKYENITYSKLRKGALYTKEYWDYFLPAAYVHPAPRILLIGLGGGTIAMQLAALLGDRFSLDAVEISKRAIELQRTFAPGIKANVIQGNGADYVAVAGKKYDVIMLDAYTSSSIPEQFLRSRFIDDAYRALSEDGVLAVNYAMNFMGMMKFNEYIARLKERFHTYKINTALFEGNVIILCSKKLVKDELLSRIAARMLRTEENEHILSSYGRMDEA